jgi:hypothetical protein
MAAPDVTSVFKEGKMQSGDGGGRLSQSHLSLFTRKQKFSPKHFK